MKVKLLAFGIARDIVGGSEINIELSENQYVVSDLKNKLLSEFPDFEKLASLRVAVNAEYVDDNFVLNPNDEVVLIPPVSGG